MNQGVSTILCNIHATFQDAEHGKAFPPTFQEPSLPSKPTPTTQTTFPLSLNSLLQLPQQLQMMKMNNQLYAGDYNMQYVG